VPENLGIKTLADLRRFNQLCKPLVQKLKKVHKAKHAARRGLMLLDTNVLLSRRLPTLVDQEIRRQSRILGFELAARVRRRYEANGANWWAVMVRLQLEFKLDDFDEPIGAGRRELRELAMNRRCDRVLDSRGRDCQALLEAAAVGNWDVLKPWYYYSLLQCRTRVSLREARE
jgi:hypothetical protein